MTAQPPGAPPKHDAAAPAADASSKAGARPSPQHLLLFHEDPPTEWLKTVALECGARGLDRLGNVGFRLLWVQRPERAAEVIQSSAPSLIHVIQSWHTSEPFV